MSTTALDELREALEKIDRPGSFCVSGSAPTVLPGLEVAGLGPIGLPLTAKQANELKKHCEQAPHGKGEETVVDTKVRRVWRLTPDRFALTNPDWKAFLEQMVRTVQEGLGLERQKLKAHLYDLLLYEKGSFFLPHRDGEKLDRMVATLVIVLPSSFEGGELIVRHEGQEQTIDFGGEESKFRIHYAAFYADCEHEIRPLRKGHRLCLVYNLTLAKSKKPIGALRESEQVERIRQALSAWAATDAPGKLAITLEHQYTQGGLTWDALKGVDRARARTLVDAARQAGCVAFLGLLTFHESGSAEDEYEDDGRYGRYGRRRRWDDYEDEDEEDEDEEDEENGLHTMGEVFDSELTATHWIDAEDHPAALGELAVDEGELLYPDELRSVRPEEEYEGYTGNEGMTLDRWYRHAAVFLWPARRHYVVLCDAGLASATEALGQLVKRWQQGGKKEAAALRSDCVEFASQIIARWRAETPRAYPSGFGQQKAEPDPLLRSLEALGEPGLIKGYLKDVLPRNTAVDPAATLVAVCREHGWATFQSELEAALGQTTNVTLVRNVRILERLCSARPRQKEGWAELCQGLAPAMLAALEKVEQDPESRHVWWMEAVPRAEVLAGLVRSLVATEQEELLARLVDDTLAWLDSDPLSVHVAALTALHPWLKGHVKNPSPALARWLAVCAEQLEGLTAEEPQPPPDWRRAVPTTLCKCADCAALKRFLEDQREHVYRFRAAEPRRKHLQYAISGGKADLDCKTDKTGSPYTLVCTKNSASYKARLHTFHENQKHLATIRAIQEALPA